MPFFAGFARRKFRRRVGLQSRKDIIDFLHVRRENWHYTRAPPRNELDKALGLQTDQGFAYRCPAHPKAQGDLRLRSLKAGRHPV